jgi:predicted glycogen debranching enzyme
MRPGESVEVAAWADDLAVPLPPACEVIVAARGRARAFAARARATDESAALLVHAADQFVVAGSNAPTVVAGYPWFGDWSRDTMTAYEGLFLDTNRADEGGALLRAAAETVSEGMLANTADAGGTEYNTVDAAMWFLHAIARHVERTGDLDLGKILLPTIDDIVQHHLAGTRFGIKVDDDGLITQGADGWALTWMDARVDGRPVTQRAGKPVEVNALWIDGLSAAVHIARLVGENADRFKHPLRRAIDSFPARYRNNAGGLLDVVDGPTIDAPVRPNQLIAASLNATPLTRDVRLGVLAAVEPLSTSIGLRSLAPVYANYIGRHRGAPPARDGAYHQGTVWPWLLGPLVDVLLTTRDSEAAERVVTEAEPHLAEWGLGSVSETADGDAPHAATGCPFQAWSVAEWLRARRLVGG